MGLKANLTTRPLALEGSFNRAMEHQKNTNEASSVGKLREVLFKALQILGGSWESERWAKRPQSWPPTADGLFFGQGRISSVGCLQIRYTQSKSTGLGLLVVKGN